MNKPNRAIAFARTQQRIAFFLITAPAESALNLILIFLQHSAVDFNGLLARIGVVQARGLLPDFSGRALFVSPYFVSSEIFDFKFNPADFHDIAFLQSIIHFLVSDLQTADHEEHFVVVVLVDAFFAGLGHDSGALCVVLDVEAA